MYEKGKEPLDDKLAYFDFINEAAIGEYITIPEGATGLRIFPGTKKGPVMYSRKMEVGSYIYDNKLVKILWADEGRLKDFKWHGVILIKKGYSEVCIKIDKDLNAGGKLSYKFR